jgi:formate hydrogenlyase subunit 3/multisubunit Na+/H+ antiporter MnhD subunit
MENRNLAIGLTIAAILLCGLPGLMSICVSTFVIIDGPFPDQPEFDWIIGITMLCSGLIFLTIPIVVGILSLRRKKITPLSSSSDEPIPPPN